MKKPTQAEIAHRLGVSRATVSRVLRNISGQKSRTAARIIEMAREVGYRLPATEQAVNRKAFSRRKNQAIGLFLCMPDVPPRSDRMPLRILHGATDATRLKNILLHVEYISVSEAQKIRSRHDLPVSLRRGAVSGIMLAGLFPPAFAQAATAQKPCVQMMIHHPGLPIDMVGQNNRTAVGQLVGFLKKQGHEKIGFLCKRPVQSYAYARFAGYIEALARTGEICDSALVVNLYMESAQPFEDVLRAVTSGVRAWICEHDGYGYELVEFLQSCGLSVPRDVVVAGFDALDVPAGLCPLPTIDWPIEDIAAAGIELLFRRINEPSRAISQLLFDGRLVDPGASY
ncbi:MAG: LacI family DNA-binding transcriptional regulator [Kiritimatiellales bacterium]